MRRRLSFWIERLLLRGPLYQLAFITVLIGSITLAGGLFGMIADPSLANDPGGSIWWAFLRITDPGYLGDDKGAARRVVSTVLTILGLAVFVGLLIAIMTQWFRQTLENLQRGFTPVSMRGHVVILGLTDRTVSVVRALVRSEHRVGRLLARLRRDRLQIVILARRIDAEVIRQLREDLEDDWGVHEIVLRSGEPWEPEDLVRADFLRASVVIIPGADFPAAGLSAVDTRTITTLLAIARAGDELGASAVDLPLVVAELHDSRKASVARAAYPGHVEVLASDTTTSNLIAQNVRHTGLSHVYSELLDASGAEIYLREIPELTGRDFHGLGVCFERAIPIGIVSERDGRWRADLNPARGRALGDGELVALVARDFDACGHRVREWDEALAPPAPLELAQPCAVRVLVLGWSHKIPTLLAELEKFDHQEHEVTVLALVPVAEREELVDAHELVLERVSVEHVEGDYTLHRALAAVDPERFDHVVMIASDWLTDAESSDSRTIVGRLLLREILRARDARPDVLVEINAASNASLFRDRPGEVLVSSQVESAMLAQVAMRPALRAVYDSLFGPGMPEIDFVSAPELELTGERAFEEVRRAALGVGLLAIGVRVHGARDEPGGGVRLDPGDGATFELGAKDDVIVLVR